MESIRQVPSKLYWFLSGIIEMILIFFLSIFKLSKPSDSLNSDDIRNIRRGRNPKGHNGNDYTYRGSRGTFCINTRFYKSVYGRVRRWNVSMLREGADVRMIQ